MWQHFLQGNNLLVTRMATIIDKYIDAINLQAESVDHHICSAKPLDDLRREGSVFAPVLQRRLADQAHLAAERTPKTAAIESRALNRRTR